MTDPHRAPAPASQQQAEPTPDLDNPGRLSRSALTVAGGTVASRVTGLLRDVVIFNWLGITPAMDALVLALRIPGTFYRFVIDSGFIRLLVPRLVQAADQFAYTAATFLPCAIVVALASAVLWLLTPWLVPLMAPGFGREQYLLAVDLIRIVVIYIPLSFITGYLAALLNSKLHYGVPAYAQMIMNLCIILATATFAVAYEQPQRIVVTAMIGGACLQICALLLPLWRLKALPGLRLAMATAEFRSLMRGLGVILLVTLPQQLGMWISFAIGSQVEMGAPSRLYLAERIIQLPLAIIGITLATVVLPVLAWLERQNKDEEFVTTLDWGLRAATVLAVPAATGLWVIGDHLFLLLFSYREMDPSEAASILNVTRSMLLSIPFAVITLLINAGYFSRQRYRVIMLSSLAGLLVLAGSAWYMALRLGYGGVGIGLGNSLGSACTAMALMVFAVYGGYWRPAIGVWLLFALRIALGCILMVLVLRQMREWLAPSLPVWLMLAVEVAVAVPLYFATLRLTGMRLHTLYKSPVRVEEQA